MQLTDSIGHLCKLDLECCLNLRNLPSSICDLTSLVHLSLSFCSNLESLPKNLGNIASLTYLNLSLTNVMQLPDSIGHLGKLEKLDLDFCKNLRNIPSSICDLTSLVHLSLYFCSNLESLPENLGNLTSLTYLDLSETNIMQLSDSIGHLGKLEKLDLFPKYLNVTKKMISEAAGETFRASPQESILATKLLAATGSVAEAEHEIVYLPGTETSPMHETSIERHGPSPGYQTSPKPGINVNSSIYQNVQKILGCLRDGKTRRIGIYGNGGIGKTTLLKALFNHTKAQDMFDVIIWVTISTYSSTEKIQNQVAEQVFSHPAGSDTSMEPISHAFRRKKVLFLLDDVSEKIDLDAVGIPNPNQENGCTIILTTRSLDVCHLMAVDTQFEMDIISMEEAWKLFHNQVGEIIDSQDIEPYARAIVAACGGLPLTIVVTGRALREENNASMWQHALLEFLSLIASSKHCIKAEIQKLKFSYNKLKSRDVKDCFLYCALIQEDHGVNISELVKYLSYEDLVARSLAEPYEKAYSIVNILLNASLLERTDDGISVKMHDIIRELALVIMSPEEEGCQFLVRGDIRLTLEPEDPNCSAVDVNVESELLNRSASEGHQFLLGASAGLTEPPANEKWEQAKMIFLMDNDFSSLPDNLSCPKLLTLCLQRNNRLRVIPKSFFVGMPRLQILNLSGTRINSLPSSLFKLKLLKVLLLHDCKRFSMLSPEIGALEHLELLDLRKTEIYNLPYAIASLTCLKHLLVSFYGTSNSSEFAKLPTELIFKGVISRLLQLNELSIDVYPGDQRWSRGVESVAKEVLNLKELKNLSFYFPEVNLLELFIQESPSWKNKGLTKFKFIVGHNVKRIVARVTEDVEFVYNQQDRCLRFVNGETVPSCVEKVLSCSTAFYLDHHLNIQSLRVWG